jgi:hypothetical protein
MWKKPQICVTHSEICFRRLKSMCWPSIGLSSKEVIVSFPKAIRFGHVLRTMCAARCGTNNIAHTYVAEIREFPLLFVASGYLLAQFLKGFASSCFKDSVKWRHKCYASLYLYEGWQLVMHLRNSGNWHFILTCYGVLQEARNYLPFHCGRRKYV